MKQNRVTIRLDDWTSDQLDSVCELIGAKRSTVIRALCLQSLTIKSNNVNDIQEIVNKDKKKKEFLLRIDDRLKNRIALLAEKNKKSMSAIIRDILYQVVRSVEQDDYYPRGAKERKASEVKINQKIIDEISNNIKVLKSAIIQDYDFDADVFQETVLLASTDKEALGVKTKGQLVAYFKRRYNMLLYRSKMEKRERRETEYADYKQTAEEEEE